MKNRFCRRTKLSEQTFFYVVTSFCIGMTAVEACDFIKSNGHRVSRQTLEVKFLELGEYLYRKRTLPASLREMRKRNTDITLSDDDLERVALDGIWNALRGTLDYAALRKQRVSYPGPDKIVRVLRARWRRFNGFRKSTLKSHVGFAAYYMLPSIQANPGMMSVPLLKMLAEDPL